MNLRTLNEEWEATHMNSTDACKAGGSPAEKPHHTDLRVVRTRKNIRAALLELLKTTPYAKINISMIAREAQINRRTFYLHYHSIDDVMIDVMDTITADIREALRPVDILSDEESLCEVFCTLRSISHKNKELIDRLMSDPDCKPYVERLSANMNQVVFDRYLAPDERNSEKTLLAAASVVGGILSVYNLWSEQGEPVPVEEAAHIAFALAHHGIDGAPAQEQA